MKENVRNQLSAVRRSRGTGAADLARRVGVSRQTIYAIEAGTYVPNTEVALRLARELEVSVEELFSLRVWDALAPKAVRAELLGAGVPEKGKSVRLGRCGNRLIAVPVTASPYFLPEADGVVAKQGRTASRAGLAVLSEGDFSGSLIVAGCDPAIGLVAGMAERSGAAVVLPAPASSRLALDWLRDGKVHIAGTHLKDPETGEFNLPLVRREYPGYDFAVVTFARWEEGFVTAHGNPKGIRKAADLARRDVRLVNREEGAGSRALLDRQLAEAGIPFAKLNGYGRVVHGHLAAAYAVWAGQADCCVATASAARAFGLDFVPLESERYDFVLRRSSLEMPQVQRFLDVLQKASLRRKLEALAGYDTARTGSMLA